MSERISSPWTGFYRTAYPILWICGTIGGLFAIWLNAIEGFAEATIGSRIALTGFGISGSLLSILVARQLRTVWLDTEQLFVSDFGKEETIDLRSIEKIVVSRYMPPKRIMIQYRGQSGDSRWVSFALSSVLLRPLAARNMVQLLRKRIDEAGR